MAEHNYPSGYARLRECIEIDPHRLDDEAIRQPSLILEVCEALADASEDRDRLTGDLEYLKSRIGREIRDDWTERKLRITNDAIEAEINNDKRVQDLLADLEKQRRTVAYWQGLLKAAEAKASSLKRLGELMTTAWNASSSIRTPRERMEDARDTSDLPRTRRRD